MLGRELVDLHVHRSELEARDLAIDLDRDRVDLLLERRVVLHHPFHRERLVRERHVHHGGRVTLGGGEVHEPALAEEVDPASVGERVLVDELAEAANAPRRQLAERALVDLDVEVSAVGEDRAVLHQLEVLASDHARVAGHGDEQVADPCGVADRHDPIPLHDGLERRGGVDLGHDHVRSHPSSTGGDTTAAHPVPGNHERLAGDQAVRRAHDRVHRRLSRPEPVVEQMLRVGVVDRHDRVRERAVRGHRAEADHPGRGFLGAPEHLGQLVGALRVEDAHQIRAVVHRDHRPEVEHGVDVLVVRVVVLAFDREGLHAALLGQGSRDVILGRQRVRRREQHLRSAGRQRFHQVGRLRRHVQARRDRDAVQRPLLVEALTDLTHDRHLAGRPVDPLPPAGRERGVSDICHVRFLLSVRGGGAIGPRGASRRPARSRSRRERPPHG